MRSSASTLVNARLGYKVNPAVHLTLEVFNAFDRKANDLEYFYASRLRGEASGIDDIHTHPAEPRAWRLGLQWRFR